MITLHRKVEPALPVPSLDEWKLTGEKQRILVACEMSGIVTSEFRKLGHDAFSCDLMDTIGNPKWHFKCDVREILYEPWDMLIAFPPCTFLSSSNARWYYHDDDQHLPTHLRRPHPKYPTRANDRASALDFVRLLLNCKIPKKAIENPVGIISTTIRKPSQYIQPWMFGHPETKKTGLWLERLPLLVPTNIVEPDYAKKEDGTYYMDKKGKRYSRIHFMSQRMSKTDRGIERSKTYPGIASAFANQFAGPVACLQN